MYYVMRASAPSLHRESTDSLILIHSGNPRCACAPRVRSNTEGVAKPWLGLNVDIIHGLKLLVWDS